MMMVMMMMMKRLGIAWSSGLRLHESCVNIVGGSHLGPVSLDCIDR